MSLTMRVCVCANKVNVVAKLCAGHDLYYT